MMQLNKKNWKEYSFGDVAIQQKENVDRQNTTLRKYVAGEHMTTEDIHIRQWGIVGADYLGPAFHRKFCKDDILYGSRRTYLKKVAVAHFDGITANTTFVIRSNDEIITPRILPFLMLSDSFTDHSVKNSKGSVNPYINWKDIASYKFKLPPLDEQKRLADLLWSVDEVIEKCNIVFSTLDCLCKIYAFKEFSGNNNKCIFLKETIELFKGKQPNKLYSDRKEGRLPYLTTDYIRNGISRFVDVSSVGENNLTDNSDILLLWDGSNAGETFLGYHGVVASTMAKIKIVANEVLPEYLYFYLRLNEDVIKRARIGSAIPHVSADFLLHLKFPVKMLNDQQKFVNKINDFENQKNMVNSSNIISRKVKEQIINQLFGGIL